MDNSQYATWLATALQFGAAWAAMMYPERRAVAWSVLGIGVLIAAVATFNWSGTGWPSWAQHGWTLYPLGMATGLAVSWLKRGWLPFQAKPKADKVWRHRNQLEVYEVACRSVGVEPDFPPPAGSALSMYRVLTDAIEADRVRIVEGTSARNTKIAHDALTQFALVSQNGELQAALPWIHPR